MGVEYVYSMLLLGRHLCLQTLCVVPSRTSVYIHWPVNELVMLAEEIPSPRVTLEYEMYLTMKAREDKYRPRPDYLETIQAGVRLS